MTTWVYLTDNTALTLADYRKRDDIPKSNVRYTLDDTTGKRTIGAPADTKPAAAPKKDGE